MPRREVSGVYMRVCLCTTGVLSCRLSRQHSDLGTSLLNELLQVDMS